MTINLKAPEDHKDLRPRITVFGVGGAGGNAVNNMIQAGLEGVEFVVANTDNQALAMSSAERRIQMGTAITEGLGAGSKPQIGGAAAEEAMPEILDQLQGSHMAFITAGMGGGTGTGAAPVIARLAREQGILTIGVVTKPFQFEGARRMAIAEAGIDELTRHVDTLIVIPNQNLFRVANERTTFADAFAMADQVLYSGVAGVTDLMVKEGLINLDFADVKTIMSGMGKAMMGTGEASGEKRAIEAAEAAIANPLLDDVSMKGARGLLISITGGEDLTLYEVDEAATRIRQEVDPDANIILGATFDQSLEGYIRVSVVATGIDQASIREEQPGQADLASARAGEAHRPRAPEAPPRYDAPRTAAPFGHGQQRHVEDDRRFPAGTTGRERGVFDEPRHEEPRGYDDGGDGYYEDDGEEQAGLPPLPASQTSGGYEQEAEVTIRRLDIGSNHSHPAPARRPVAEEEAYPRHDPNRPFIPPEAESVPRSTRMPRVDELPMPARRQMQARDGGGDVHHGIERQKRKAGFLERLTGVGRGRDHDDRDYGAGDAHATEPRLAPVRRQAPLPRQPAPHEEPIARPAGPMPAAEAHPQAGDDDQLEIPAFLRRQAN